MGRDARGADVVAAQGPCGPPNTKKKQVDRPCDARPSNQKKQVDRVLTRAPIDPKKKTLKTISTNRLSCQCLCAGAGRATEAPNRVLLYKPRSLAELERHDGGRRDAVQLGRAIGNLPPGLARAAFVAFPPTFFGYKATPPPAFVRFQVRCALVGGVVLY